MFLNRRDRSHRNDRSAGATPWPFVTAFGLTLLVAGLVTSLAVV